MPRPYPFLIVSVTALRLVEVEVHRLVVIAQRDVARAAVPVSVVDVELPRPGSQVVLEVPVVVDDYLIDDVARRVVHLDGRLLRRVISMNGHTSGQLRHSNQNLSLRNSTTRSIPILFCSIVSRSRTVTCWSSSESKSIVTQKGVPTSSCRR